MNVPLKKKEGEEPLPMCRNKRHVLNPEARLWRREGSSSEPWRTSFINQDSRWREAGRRNNIHQLLWQASTLLLSDTNMRKCRWKGFWKWNTIFYFNPATSGLTETAEEGLAPASQSSLAGSAIWEPLAVSKISHFLAEWMEKIQTGSTMASWRLEEE